jgi:hypothetical protein
MNDAERLAAIEAITQLKARYFRSMDIKDWDGFQSVFAPDAVFDATEAMFARDPATGACIQNGRVIDEPAAFDESLLTRGAPAIRATVEAAIAPLVTIHHGHMPEIEVTSATTARGIWAMEDVLHYPAESPFTLFVGFGHYHETYERIDGRWHIKTLKLTRLRVDQR